MNFIHLHEPYSHILILPKLTDSLLEQRLVQGKQVQVIFKGLLRL